MICPLKLILTLIFTHTYSHLPPTLVRKQNIRLITKISLIIDDIIYSKHPIPSYPFP